MYLDTSVISHLFAEDTPEKMMDTNKLWGELAEEKYEVYISPLVIEEIKACHEPKRSQMLEKLEQIQYEGLELSSAVSNLAEEYLHGGVLKEKSHGDCLHIAFAVVYNCDIIVSWNFKHLVNYKTINKVKIVNAINRYQEISIISPTMLIEEVD
jgi:predicted nucleic acid-binding protein